jgi:putative N6-adenine-specific DNA methylase
MMRANLWLRSASRVVVRVARFRATAFFELEKRASEIEWGRFLGRRPAAFRVTARKSKLYHSDAIAERLQRALGARPAATGNSAPGSRREPAADYQEQLFVVRVVRDEFEISADTSGALLHMRGYRAEAGKAPLRETLAAALLLASEWTGDTPLLDPFCGSGTIPIEGAMIARNIAPGFRRPFAFMDWPGFEEREWRRLRDAARSAQRPAAAEIAGSDRDAGAIASSVANAERAGVSADVTFTKQALSHVTPPDRAGLVATNPPYGVRVSAGADVRNLYAQLGNVLRERFDGWRLAAYVPAMALAKQTRLPVTALFTTSNGGIRVTAAAAAVARSSGTN